MSTKGICLIYGLGADFSLLTVGDNLSPTVRERKVGKVSDSIAGPSPAGISEPRAEISWCIVMVQRSVKVSRGTAVDCIFLSFSAILILGLQDIVGKEAFHSCPLSCPCQIVDGYCVLFIAFNPILHIKHVPLKM